MDDLKHMVAEAALDAAASAVTARLAKHGWTVTRLELPRESPLVRTQLRARKDGDGQEVRHFTVGIQELT